MNIENEALIQRIDELEKENAVLKEQQFKITEAKELYLKIFEDFPALIWRSRLDKLCDYFNKTWLEFTGRSMEQEFGNGWAEGVHPDDFDACLNTYVTSFDKREAFLMEYRMKNKYGEYRWIRDFGRPFYDLDNTFLGYIGSCYDITDNKNNELKLIGLNAAKDKFFSIIAHDLRSPFSAILGFSGQLIQLIHDKEYDQVEEVASTICSTSDRVIDLLSNLMGWAQSQTGRLNYNPEILDMNRVVDDVLLLMKGNADQKSICISARITPGLRVTADKSMVGTVMRNLISNAIKFTNLKGEIVVSSAVQQNEVVFSVADNGIGIAEERIGKLFQISDSKSTRGTQQESGTGLGLILCKEFVEMNRGRIWVESVIGAGTTFSFSLPLA